MPDFLRAYGEALRQKEEGEFMLFAVPVGIVLLVLATITIGALILAIVRAWGRSRARRHPPTVRVTPFSRHQASG